MAKPWVRLYRDAINNPKVGRLTLEERGFWMTLLMISDDDGWLPEDDDLAWKARVTECETSSMVQVMLRHGLVTRDVTNRSRLRLHDWDQHQHASDADPTARERKQRQREREKSQKSAVTRDVTTGHANVTRTDTDTDTDTDKKDTSLRSVAREGDGPALRVVEKSQPTSRAPAGSSWSPDAVIPDDWVRDAEAARARAGKTQIDLEPEAERFANHFAANGKRMKDWRRAWLNWATSPYVDQLKGAGNGSRTGAKSQLEQLADIARDGLHGTVING
jgi:hypothetical protein